MKIQLKLTFVVLFIDLIFDKTSIMKLSKITEIPPRKYWQSESSDFTPWLAEEENIALLGEAISLDLEVVSREEKMR